MLLARLASELVKSLARTVFLLAIGELASVFVKACKVPLPPNNKNGKSLAHASTRDLLLHDVMSRCFRMGLSTGQLF